MKKILLVIANMIALTCAMSDWQLVIPPRLAIYDVLSILFIVVWLLFYSTKKVLLNKDIKLFMSLEWAYFAIMVMSGINIVLIYNSQESFVQFYKGISSNGMYVAFASCFCMFMHELEPRERNQILAFFIAGVIFSSLYGILGSILYKSYNLRIETFWNYVSYNVGPRYDESLDWQVMGIRRGFGFPGINAAATYNMTAIPLLLLYALYRGRLKDYLYCSICFVGLLVTLSRTGFITFIVSLIALFVLTFKEMKSAVFKLLIFASPFIAMGYIWWEYVTEIMRHRAIALDARSAVWESGLALFFDNPFLGLGVNNYSVVRETLASQYFHEANLHNSWLTILVELGPVGLICYVVFVAFIVWKATIRPSILSKGFVCAIVGLSVGAISNQLFDSFYFQFFITLVFSMVALGDGQFLNTQHYRSPKPLALRGI
jgi:O-Antigen ligase